MTVTIWGIFDKNDRGTAIVCIGMFVCIILCPVGMFCYTDEDTQYYRQRLCPQIEDVNMGYATIDSIGVLNGITQYEIRWKGSQTGPRKQ